MKIIIGCLFFEMFTYNNLKLDNYTYMKPFRLSKPFKTIHQVKILDLEKPSRCWTMDKHGSLCFAKWINSMNPYHWLCNS